MDPPSKYNTVGPMTVGLLTLHEGFNVEFKLLVPQCERASNRTTNSVETYFLFASQSSPKALHYAVLKT